MSAAAPRLAKGSELGLRYIASASGKWVKLRLLHGLKTARGRPEATVRVRTKVWLSFRFWTITGLEIRAIGILL
jgi:hypothetical protein